MAEIMSLIISYQTIAVPSQAQWWPKLICVQSLVSFFQRRSLSYWNSCGKNSLSFISCLLVPWCHIKKGASVPQGSALHTPFLFFHCLSSKYSDIIILNGIIKMLVRKCKLLSLWGKNASRKQTARFPGSASLGHFGAVQGM